MPEGFPDLIAVVDDVTGLVGRTPLVRLRRVARGAPAAVLVKVEAANPAGSSKDRAALSMVRAAEASGELRPGGVIFEGSSGNTGIALAMIGAALGYRVVVVVPDRSSQEKLGLLRAYGAEVVITPALLPAEHPDQVRALAARLAAQTPGGWYAGQYDNPANIDAHYTTTGPEIWAQTGGAVTHLVAGIGTGGTLTGAGRYLREVSGDRVQVVGADPESSVYGGGSGRPHLVEATGRFVHPDTGADVWPRSYGPSVATTVRQVPDRESIAMTRALAREEGLLLGASGGLAVAAAVALAHTLGPDDVVVAIAPDSGRSYLSKYFDDDWVSRRGFGPDTGPVPAAAFVTIPHSATVDQARAALRHGHALPVVVRTAEQTEPVSLAQVIGSASPEDLRDAAPQDLVVDHLGPALPLAGAHEPVSTVRDRLTPTQDAVVITHDGLVIAVLPRSELDDRTTGIGDLVTALRD
ncbi:PLP-dependent cysteine synthase family protein [Actinokineospora terrae]|uniref:Cystathionine beta-synthase n=1 Tax=Actinokineospora terrae TaxID=155974 RepID=A0A1H9X0G3_9PSEU|nr:pyridoxal-phosphate dependent enzyme [Actinokineospora terrae]SES39579.1 cystathionine beta-synthase [Actinokineospora terrae]